MKNFTLALLIALFAFPAIAQEGKVSEPPPSWAYGFTTPPGPRPASGPPVAAATPGAAANPYPDDGTLKHLPESKLAFTITQIRDNFNPADWYPEDHPAMRTIRGAW